MERPLLRVSPAGYTSSIICGSCHYDIYQNWRKSLHANSYSEPIFKASYMEVYLRTRGKVETICLRCHAPVAAATGDYGLENDISREGITCDFCHSVKGVNLNKEPSPFELEPGLMMRGPGKGNSTEAHGTSPSPLFTQSLFCAGCHEYKSPKGVSIFTTYSEWLKSPMSREGKSCQSCHMPLIPGEVTRGEKEGGARLINQHRITGASSLEQLRRAIEVEVKSPVREGEELRVEVLLRNAGAGHMVPTGLPTKKLILDVTALTTAGRTLTQRMVYQRQLADSEGEPITIDSDLFLDAAQVMRDNRLAPMEMRRETFTFKLKPGEGAIVRTELYYHYSPLLVERTEQRVRIGGRELEVPAR